MPGPCASNRRSDFMQSCRLLFRRFPFGVRFQRSLHLSLRPGSRGSDPHGVAERVSQVLCAAGGHRHCPDRCARIKETAEPRSPRGREPLSPRVEQADRPIEVRRRHDHGHPVAAVLQGGNDPLARGEASTIAIPPLNIRACLGTISPVSRPPQENPAKKMRERSIEKEPSML